jgi:hypothetical protein
MFVLLKERVILSAVIRLGQDEQTRPQAVNFFKREYVLS